MSSMKNLSIVDLRTITNAETLKDIEEMKNIGVIILPENGDPDVMNAIHAIPKSNIGHMLTLPYGVEIHQMTGDVTLSAAILKANSIVLITGNAVVEEVVEECNASLIMTGNLIYPKGCPLKIHSTTGNAKAYDYEHYVAVDDDFELDADTLDLMEYKTLLNIDGDLRIAKDVTIEMLKEKMPYFVVDGDARCQKSIAAFMKLRSHVDGDFRIKGNRYEDDEDDDE
ncbi:MAG: hypothetical protein IJ411_03800 [Oscillospiraceae bacterium]|nr:hypothetical protein [Oscillospiraceae bacterium]